MTDQDAAVGSLLRLPGLGGVSGRRRLIAAVILLRLLLALTAVLASLWGQLALSADLLAYLLAVVIVAVIGRLYPALVAALASAGLADLCMWPLRCWAVELAARLERLAARALRRPRSAARCSWQAGADPSPNDLEIFHAPTKATSAASLSASTARRPQPTR